LAFDPFSFFSIGFFFPHASFLFHFLCTFHFFYPFLHLFFVSSLSLSLSLSILISLNISQYLISCLVFSKVEGRVTEHLIRGDREGALSAAVAGKAWALALVIASVCSPERYKEVTALFSFYFLFLVSHYLLFFPF